MLNKAVAGPVGSLVLLFGVVILAYVGWTSIPIVMFGRATNEAFGWAGVTGPMTSPVLWSFIALGIASFILWKFTGILKYFFRIVTPLIIFVLLLVTYKIISMKGFGNIAAIVPEGFHTDPFVSFMIAVEMNVGLGFSWVFCFAIYCRLAKSETGAFYGTWIGWGPIWGIATLPAVLGGLAAAVNDPVYILKEAGGYWVPMYMIFLGIANIFSGLCTMYIVSLAARTAFPNLRWGQAVAINWLVIILILWPGAYDKYGAFIALIGAVCGPVGVVVVVDLFLRRFAVNLPELYDETSNSAYYYWKGINPWVFVSMAIGTIISLSIYNPATAVPHIIPIFKICGAAIPGSLAAGLFYFIVAKVFLIPKKIGFPEIPPAGKAVVSKSA